MRFPDHRPDSDGSDSKLLMHRVNRVVVFPKLQVDFLDRIKKIYKRDQNIALITVDIKNLDGMRQNPLQEKPPSIYKVIILKLFL